LSGLRNEFPRNDLKKPCGPIGQTGKPARDSAAGVEDVPASFVLQLDGF
jgi:hypothetical protein